MFEFIFCVLMITTIVCMGLYTKAKIDYIKNKTRLEEVELLEKIDVSGSKENIKQFINNFVEECIDEYVLKNITPDRGITYINSDMETKMRNGIKEIVVNRMSNVMLKKIGMYYNEDEIGAILADTIFMMISIYPISNHRNNYTKHHHKYN